jgi:hypothetical protein
MQFLRFAKTDVMNTTVLRDVEKSELGVEHFVIEDKADDIFGDQWIIQPPVDHDRMMGRIVMAEAPLAFRETPTELVNLERVVEKPAVQILKESAQVKDISGLGSNSFPPPLSSEVPLSLQRFRTVHKVPAPLGHRPGSYPARDLVDELHSKGFHDRVGGVAEQIGESDLENVVV